MRRVLFALALAAAAPAAALAQPQVEAGQKLFETRCGICHAGFAPGTIMLGRRLGQDHALLAQRTDLQAPYIRTVVRHGLRGMPPFTRVDLGDAELGQITAYLTRDHGDSR